jgi:dTDP-4-dehydrorhamnose 3,5-epimerase
MIFTETKLPGAFILEPERHEDDRGFFARIWCQEEFEKNGLDPRLAQCSISFNKTKGTLRGMHYQAAPHEEAKLVRCTMGALYDVIIDLRAASNTLNEWLAVELTAENRKMLYVPRGFAHGFLTLEDNTEVLYLISDPYVPGSAGGVRWNDPAFHIEWPGEIRVISERDNGFPDFHPETSA